MAFKFNWKVAQDIAVWTGTTGTALLASAQNMVWDSRPHRIANIGAMVAVLVAALKNIPDIPSSTPSTSETPSAEPVAVPAPRPPGT